MHEKSPKISLRTFSFYRIIAMLLSSEVLHAIMVLIWYFEFCFMKHLLLLFNIFSLLEEHGFAVHSFS